MPKTVIIEVSDDFDFGKVLPFINAGTGFRVLKPNETLHVIESNDAKGRAPNRAAPNRSGDGIIPTIAAHFTPRGEFIALQAQAWLKQAGYNPRSASPALTHLCNDGILERIGSGKFRFVRPLAPGEKVVRKSNATG